MLNVPDYVLEEELELHTYNKVSVEPAQPRYSDFKMPVFTSETFINLISEHVSQISIDQWNLLAFGKTDFSLNDILADLYEHIVDTVFMLVSEAIEPQFVSSTDSANTSVTADKNKAPKGKRNLRGVTEEDIRTSLGDSINQCLAEVMGCTETKTSKHSEQLRQLVAEEAASSVNYELGVQSVEMEVPESKTKKTVRHIRKILTQYVLKGACSESVDSCDSDCSDCSMLAMPPSSTEEELSQEDKDFFTVLLTKLLDKITQSTKIAIFAFDYDRVIKLLMNTMGETKLPSTCGNLPQDIFENLCQELGSARLVQAAIIYDELEFTEALARELKSQLEKMSQKPPSFFSKVGSYFRRTSNKVVPACEDDAMLTQRDIIHTEKNGSTRPTIQRMFSAMVQYLRKPFL